jgi:putative sigma-54 modulation protein
MEVKIHSRNLRIRENLEEYTHKKLERLDRYLPGISHVQVEISRYQNARTGDQVSAQITVRHTRGAILRAEERVLGEDYDAIKAAIDLAVDKLNRQVERFKGKNSRKGRERYGVYIASQEEMDTAEEIVLPTDTGDMRQYNDDYEIVRRKEVSVVPMSEEQAIEQMELLDHAFFVFFNQQTNSVNVLYRREAGGYGVLVPHSK